MGPCYSRRGIGGPDSHSQLELPPRILRPMVATSKLLWVKHCPLQAALSNLKIPWWGGGVLERGHQRETQARAHLL